MIQMLEEPTIVKQGFAKLPITITNQKLY